MFPKLAMQSATPLKKLKTSCKQFTNKKTRPDDGEFFIMLKIIDHTIFVITKTDSPDD